MKKLKLQVNVTIMVNDITDDDEIKERLYEVLQDQMETEEIDFSEIDADDLEDIED